MIITVVLYNGLCNRLNTLISVIRLAKKFNKKVNIIWTYTPVRSGLEYFGETCSLHDIFKHNNIIYNDIKPHPFHHDNYEFKYWDDKDYIININYDNNIFINYCLFPVISQEDDSNSFFKNLKDNINQPQEIIFDKIGIELKETFINELKPIDDIQNEINKTKNLFFKNMIGIHIRKTDGGFVNIDWKPIIKTLIDYSKNWCNQTDNGILLSTDDIETYLVFTSNIGNKLITYNPPQILCNTTSPSGHKFNNDKYNVIVGFIELNLLSLCNTMIIGTAGSTFSFTSMLLSDFNTKKYLINSPDNIPLFTNNKQNYDTSNTKILQ